jgi:hypothetical protein
MTPGPMIPGGETERVGRQGGEQLAREMMVLAGGHEIPTIVYAMVDVLTSVCLHLDTLPAASDLANNVAADAINQLELNWPDRERLFAEARASYHNEAGHG